MPGKHCTHWSVSQLAFQYCAKNAANDATCYGLDKCSFQAYVLKGTVPRSAGQDSRDGKSFGMRPSSMRFGHRGQFSRILGSQLFLLSLFCFPATTRCTVPSGMLSLHTTLPLSSFQSNGTTGHEPQSSRLWAQMNLSFPVNWLPRLFCYSNEKLASHLNNNLKPAPKFKNTCLFSKW